MGDWTAQCKTVGSRVTECGLYFCASKLVHWPALEIFNLSADVNACEFMWGWGVGDRGGVEGRECCMNTVRESALKVDGEKTLLLHQGRIEPVSTVCWARCLTSCATALLRLSFCYVCACC